MRSGKGQIIRAGWFADYPIADNFLFPLLHSKSIDGDNLERYNSKAFDALVDSARSTTNKSFSQSQYRRAEVQALRNDVVITQTVNRGIAAVLAASTSSFPITPLGMVVYDQIVKN
jgi:oligopeptide transport system substrate-binding protein